MKRPERRRIVYRLRRRPKATGDSEQQMSIDLSFRALFRSGSKYRITGTYDGVDLLNGGWHRAVDVGNFGMNDPILSPINGRAEGLRHFDGALGVRYHLGDGWTLELWHLNSTLALGGSVPVSRGQVCGRTGNTGANLPDGSPMPAHTHIELERGGQKYDAAPYLLGKAFVIGGEDESMKFGGEFDVISERYRTRDKARFRSDTNLKAVILKEFGGGVPLLANGRTNAGEAVNGNPQWITAWLYVDKAYLLGAFHASAVERVLEPVAPVDTRLERIATAAEGAAQAIAVIQGIAR